MKAHGLLFVCALWWLSGTMSAYGADSSAVDEPVSDSRTTAGQAVSSQRDSAIARWDPRWRRFQLWQYAATAASYGILAYVQYGTYSSPNPKWEGGILLDDWVQDGIRLRSRSGRETAGTFSDVFWGLSFAFPMVDSLVLAPLVHRDLDLAWQTLLIDAQAIGLVAMLSRIMHKTTRRARPLYARCQEQPDYDRSCGAPSSVASFWSGHTAMAATAAGLTCAHHQHVPLWGGGLADQLACGGSVVMATMTGVMRMMADQHYISDTLVGFAMGFGVGYGLPTLLHYRWGWLVGADADHEPAARMAVVPYADSVGGGLNLLGLF